MILVTKDCNYFIDLSHIKKMCGQKKVVVLVDELDRGWDNSEDAKAFVAGLVQAAMSLNECITLGRSGLHVSPLCLGCMTFGEDWGSGLGRLGLRGDH